MQPQLHHLDVVFEDREARGIRTPESRRQGKAPTTRTANGNDGASDKDPAIRERWWRDNTKRVRNYSGANKPPTVRQQNSKFASS